MEEIEFTITDKVNSFFVKNRKVLLIVFGVVFAVVLVVIGSLVFFEHKGKVDIAEIETIIIDFEKFKKDNIKNTYDSLTEAEKKLLSDEEIKVIEKLSKHINANNYSAFMAIQQIADIYFKNREFEKALSFYEKAPISNKYICGVLFFNAGTCADELGQTDKAIQFYNKASECIDFPFKARALFNVARVQESTDTSKAVETYNSIIAKYPNTEWSNLSKTRLIELKLKN